MMLARWSIDARFGHKQAVIDRLQRWMREIAPEVGFTPERTRLLTGSIGTLEATVQSEHLIESLTELQNAWDKLAALEAHRQWGHELEPYVVSGTSRWEILRVL
jgi:hypothetical protein